jgi:hypothetical protein
MGSSKSELFELDQNIGRVEILTILIPIVFSSLCHCVSKLNWLSCNLSTVNQASSAEQPSHHGGVCWCRSDKHGNVNVNPQPAESVRMIPKIKSAADGNAFRIRTIRTHRHASFHSSGTHESMSVGFRVSRRKRILKTSSEI